MGKPAPGVPRYIAAILVKLEVANPGGHVCIPTSLTPFLRYILSDLVVKTIRLVPTRERSGTTEMG